MNLGSLIHISLAIDRVETLEESKYYQSKVSGDCSSIIDHDNSSR
jgi:hypothetical protein